MWMIETAFSAAEPIEHALEPFIQPHLPIRSSSAFPNTVLESYQDGKEKEGRAVSRRCVILLISRVGTERQ